ncbi:hypothetical protein SB782_36025 [Brevibacillus sp. SIMBA_076]
MEVPEDNVAACGDEAGTSWVVSRPQLHVCSVGRVTNVKRVEQQYPT